MAKAVIMAGGPGERFWPLTHKKFPKYRIRLDKNESLLQKTYRRLLKIYSKSDVYVVTTKNHAPLIKSELPSLKRSNLIIEPMRRNTAAAIYLSCRVIYDRFGAQEIVSFFPADHLIRNEQLFKQTLTRAIALAKKKELLITIGIRPTFPATGYGYIEAGSALAAFPDAYRVKRFKEKPNRAKAIQYLKSGRTLWNGGIFTWKVGTFLEAMKKAAPAFGRQSYGKLPKLSIDTALLEKVKNLAVIKTRMDWCDMGSWDMFHEKALRDKHNNLVEGPCRFDVVRGSLIVNQSSAPVIALGLKDLIVVQTKQGTLICKKGFSEDAALLSRRLD